MFDSKAILWEKGGPLATAWIAANLSKCKSFRVKLTRRDYSKTDVVRACSVLMTEEELTLRLSSHLLLGIVRIHCKQTHYALQESEELVKRFNLLSQKFSIDIFETIRPGAVTLPDPLDGSLPSLHDFNLSNMETLSLYFRLDINSSRPISAHSGSPISPIPVLPPGSSPPFTANPKDISIAEQPEEGSVLEDSLWDCQYFGDEDPALIADQRKTLISHHPSPSSRKDHSHQVTPSSHVSDSPHQQDGNQSDLVLLYNQESGAFEYSREGSDVSGGTQGSDVSVGGSSREEDKENPLELASPSTPKGFDIPVLSALNSKTTPTTTPGSEQAAGGEEPPAKKKRRERRRKKLQVLDIEKEMDPNMIKSCLRNKHMSIGTADYTKQFKRHIKAIDLLSQPFSNSVKYHVLASQCRAALALTPEEMAANQVPLFKLSSLGGTKGGGQEEEGEGEEEEGGGKYTTPMIGQVRTTPTSTPLVVGGVLPQRRPHIDMSAIRGGDETRRLSHLDTEVPRRDSDHIMSSEDPLRTSSHMLISGGDSAMISNSKSSLQMSALTRANSDLVEGRSDMAPLTHLGILSPIMDVENEMDITPAGPLPELEDLGEIEISASPTIDSKPHPSTSSSSSPFIESKAAAYCHHVAAVMGGRSEIEFRELLPSNATKKTACVAFSHVLTLISNYQFLSARQTEPYGVITLQRGERF